MIYIFVIRVLSIVITIVFFFISCLNGINVFMVLMCEIFFKYGNKIYFGGDRSTCV